MIITLYEYHKGITEPLNDDLTSSDAFNAERERMNIFTASWEYNLQVYGGPDDNSFTASLEFNLLQDGKNDSNVAPDAEKIISQYVI